MFFFGLLLFLFLVPLERKAPASSGLMCKRFGGCGTKEVRTHIASPLPLSVRYGFRGGTEQSRRLLS